jgi:hypothetical protein
MSDALEQTDKPLFAQDRPAVATLGARITVSPLDSRHHDRITAHAFATRVAHEPQRRFFAGKNEATTGTHEV